MTYDVDKTFDLIFDNMRRLEAYQRKINLENLAQHKEILGLIGNLNNVVTDLRKVVEEEVKSKKWGWW